jgi:hypothetical protein
MIHMGTLMFAIAFGLVVADTARHQPKRVSQARGAPGKTPFVAAVETTQDGKSVRLKLRRATSFCRHAIWGFAKSSLNPDCAVVSDGLLRFTSVTDAGCSHQVIRTGSGRQAARTPAFN